MSSLLTDLSVKCELQAMDILALRKQVFELDDENAELRELVRDMWRDGMCDCDECGAFAQGEYHCAQCEYHFPDRIRELGIEIEVDDD